MPGCLSGSANRGPASPWPSVPICGMGWHWEAGLPGDQTVLSLPSAQLPRRAPPTSSAAMTASALPRFSSATRTGTAWTAPTRRSAQSPPAAPPASSATAPPASLSCGPATVTPTARMAPMSGRSTAGTGTRPAPEATAAPARRWSSIAAAANASTPAGAATATPTAKTSRTRTAAVGPGAPCPCPRAHPTPAVGWAVPLGGQTI